MKKDSRFSLVCSGSLIDPKVLHFVLFAQRMVFILIKSYIILNLVFWFITLY